MTKPELEQWLANEGATNVVVVPTLDHTWTVRVAFDVGSNQASRVLDELDRYLYATAACGVQFSVTCRNTYTGAVTREVMPRPDRPVVYDSAQRDIRFNHASVEARVSDPSRTIVYYPRSVLYMDEI